MNRLLLLIILSLSWLFSCEQTTNYLFIKKGYKKVKTYLEGDRIILQTQDGTIYGGLITHLIDNTIYINGHPVIKDSVKAIITGKAEKKFHVSGKELLLLNAGAILITTGLAVSKQETFKRSVIAGLTIAYAPLALPFLKSLLSFKRKKFSMGKKYRLQVLDFQIPRKRYF